MHLITELPRLPDRSPTSHKGTFGRCVLVGGSRGMAGSISLAGAASLRSGAGLVTVGVPDPILDVVASLNPCYMTIGLPVGVSGQLEVAMAKDLLRDATTHPVALGCGPGFGTTSEAQEISHWLYQNITSPGVFDADALNAFAQQDINLSERGGDRVLTPHPGEFRRLTQMPSATVEELRKIAIPWAADRQVTLVLKGHQTLVTDGTRVYQNTTGNPGMATGGSGDVLTGVITAFLAQGLSAFEAAQLGTFVHGLAADLAIQQIGMVSLIASDIIEHLPNALQ